MVDLSAPSVPSVPSVPSAPSAPSALAAVARSAGNSPLRGGSAHASPFEAVLAQELGEISDGHALPGRGGLATAAKPAAAADADLKPGDDATQTAAAGAAPLLPAYAGVIPFPPALAGLSIPPSTSAGVSPLPTGNTQVSAGRVTLAPDARQGKLAKASVAAKAELQLPTASTAADFAVHGQFLRGAADETAQTSAAAEAEPGLPIASAAADFAAPGKFALSVEGEIRREFAFGTALLDQHKSALAGALHAHSTAPAPAMQAPAAAPVATLDARVGERGWDQGLGDKLVWMAGQKHQVAELHLNPTELGPLKITLTLNHDQASAQFVSAHAPVREAIEAAMPRLREMLADSGITLGNTSVSTDAFREQAQPQHEPRAYQVPPAEAAADAGGVTRGERLLQRSLGLVDTFA